jgi:hypothetical protein
MPGPGKKPTRTPLANGNLSVDWSNLHPLIATCNSSFVPLQCPVHTNALVAVCLSRAVPSK